MINFYEYAVDYFDESEQAEKHVTGIVAGESKSEAIDYILDWYEDDNIMSIYLRETNRERVYEIPIEDLP